MKKRIGTLILVSLCALLLTGCGGMQPSGAMDGLPSTYTIAHKDAKELLNPERDYLITVNRYHPYDFNGEYHKQLQADLVYFPNVVDGDIMATEKAAYLAFTSLQYDLRVNDGIEIGLYDGYRTASDQEFINQLYAEGSPGVTAQNEIGLTEHHTGLLLDYVVWHQDGGETYVWCSPTPKRIEAFPEYRVVLDKMVDYGFINRYPTDKAEITGIEGREFEMRFVGSAEVAHEIMDNGLCLEEYLSQR